MVRLLATLAAVSSVALAAPVELEARQGCASGFYIIAGRGSTEAPGYGKTAQVVNGIIARVPGSVGVAVDYPASITSPPYPESVTDGINDTENKIRAYVDMCGSSSRIVLVGFSQGANVMSDTLAGGVDKPDPISTEYSQYISAVVLFGDPSHTKDQSYDVGSGSGDNGIFHRDQGGASLALLNTYASIIQDYCTADDTFCASGDSDAVHSNEVPMYASAAIDFVVSMA